MLSDPYEESQDDGLEISLSGLPEDPDEPEGPEGVEGVEASGPEEPEGDFEDEAEDLREEAQRDEDQADQLDIYVDTDQETDGDSDSESESDLATADAEPDLDDEDEGDEEDDADAELAYDLAEWDNDRLDALFASLDEHGIAYLWDGEELFVQAAEELTVDDVIERIDNPDAFSDEDGGDSGGALLGDLFVVADQLQHDPEAHESVANLLKLADVSDEADAPYGLDDTVWEGLRERVTTLATLLEDEKPDGDEVISAAIELRSAIRPYV